MSTIIPIQELDTSANPPSNATIRAVVTLLWPYSSSTRQCALLLSERDFRLRAKGGQIRVKFSGPAARTVAEGRLGIGNEVELELGTGQWARDESGVAVHVPGKSVGELQFGKGVRLRVKKEGLDPLEINVAEDAVDRIEREQEKEQEKEKELLRNEATPTKRTASSTNFRSSIGGTPGSTAIYSSPAYVRRAAKFSYLDGLSRLFEDEWDSQDLPRKKARTSIGEVRNWRVVDRTPSPETHSPELVTQVDQEMAEAGTAGEIGGEEHSTDSPPANESADGQTLTAEVTSIASSPVSVRAQQQPGTGLLSKDFETQAGPLEQLASSVLEGQRPADPQSSTAVPPLPELKVPSASPTPRSNGPEPATTRSRDDPVTPRLAPLPSAALPSTTPQISPLATKLGSEPQADAGPAAVVDKTSQSVELPGIHDDDRTDKSTTPKQATEGLLEQIQLAPSETESAVDTATQLMTSERSLDVDALGQPSINDLAEEDAFSSDDEANERLSAQEHDDEIMQEDDAGDVFDSVAFKAESASDDDTTEDREMHEAYGQAPPQWIDESTTERDTDLEDAEHEQPNSRISTKPQSPAARQLVPQQPGFAPASTLLHATETPMKAASVTSESGSSKTPLVKHKFISNAAVLSTEDATTPPAKPADTPKKTPQSTRDKVMKRTFSSLFGIKGTPSPEKEDAIAMDDGKKDTDGVVGPKKQDDLVTQKDQQSMRAPETVASIPGEAALVDVQDHHHRRKSAAEVLTALHSLPNDSYHSAIQPQEPSALQAEPTRLGQQPAELIDLASSSDEEEETRIEDAALDESPSKVARPIPQKRSLARPDEAFLAAGDESEDTLADDTRASAAPVQNETADPLLIDTEVDSGERQVPPTLRLEPSPSRRAVGASDHENFTAMGHNEAPALLETTVEPETHIPGSKDQAPASVEPDAPLQAEPNSSLLIESGLQNEVQSESLDIFEGLEDIPGQTYDIEMQMDEHDALVKSPKPAQSSPLHVVTDAGLPSVIPGQLSPVDRGVKSPSRPHEEDIMMLDDDQEVREPSSVSFQSQIEEGDAKAPRLDDQEASSRPASRDTVETFSPVVLGSMAQRIADTVSHESAVERLQELESQEDIAIEVNNQEELGPHPVTSNTEEVEERELTPTPALKHTEVVELLSSPSGSYDFSPVKYTQSTQEQASTLETANAENKPQETLRVEEAVMTSQQADALGEDPSFERTEEIQDQLQTPDMTAETAPKVTHNISAEETIQREPTEGGVVVEESAHLTLPLSPSATHTQAAGSDAPLSHANIAQAAMQAKPLSAQSDTDQQRPVDHIAPKVQDQPEMAQTYDQEKEKTEMPPPEQAVPPKTPARRKSLRSRLSNVPDVISAWFSPKRSSVAAQETEKAAQVEKPAASTADAVQTVRRSPRKHASGISTAHAYFTSLASLEQHLNPSSQQSSAVDVLAVVTDFAKEPERAKAGPKDYFTIFKITDLSMPDASNVRVEVYRPWKAVLPAADVGDVVLLRAFVVKSKKRQPYLLSTDSSGWCVWRFAEHSKAIRGPDHAEDDGDKPAWARRMSHGDVREEVKGPPVEYGVAEKAQAKKLRDWWNGTHVEAHDGVVGEKDGNQVDRDAEAAVF